MFEELPDDFHGKLAWGKVADEWVTERKISTLPEQSNLGILYFSICVLAATRVTKFLKELHCFRYFYFEVLQISKARRRQTSPTVSRSW